MTDQPNIILVTIDCLRNDYYGLPNPNLKFQRSLIQKSNYFPNCFSLAHNTDTSFSQFLSSTFLDLIPRNSQIKQDEIDLNRYRMISPRISIAQTLKSIGYNTYGFQTVPKLSPFFGFDKGFDYYRYFNPFVRGVIPGITHAYKPPSISAKQVNNFVLEKEFREPYFLWIHYNDLHEPYSSSRFPLPLSYLLWYRFINKSLTKESSNLENDKISPNLIRKFRELYKKQVVNLDKSLHNLFVDSEKFNIEESLFILSADHGQFLGEHNQMGHGYDNLHTRELYNVPLYISHPEQFSSVTDDRLCTLLDIVPTICDIIEIPKLKRYDGNSLLEESWKGYDHLIWSNLSDYDKGKFSVRIIDEPFFYWRDDFNSVSPKVYHLVDDVIEKYSNNKVLNKFQNLEKYHLEFIKNKREEYSFDSSESKTESSNKMDPMVIESLRAMGYIK